MCCFNCCGSVHLKRQCIYFVSSRSCVKLFWLHHLRQKQAQFLFKKKKKKTREQKCRAFCSSIDLDVHMYSFAFDNKEKKKQEGLFVDCCDSEVWIAFV